MFSKYLTDPIQARGTYRVADAFQVLKNNVWCNTGGSFAQLSLDYMEDQLDTIEFLRSVRKEETMGYRSICRRNACLLVELLSRRLTIEKKWLRLGQLLGKGCGLSNFLTLHFPEMDEAERTSNR